MGHILFALLLAVAAVLLVAGGRLRERYPVAAWYVVGYPLTALRIVWHWRDVARHTDLAVSPSPARTLIADVIVTGRPLRPVAPRISFPKPTRTGVSLLVRLHPGQTPELYKAAADALAHAWRVHAVRVTSPDRGFVHLTATAVDPLQHPGRAHAKPALLSALVGILEAGGAWVLDFRTVPHWMIVGATQSGKSTLLARLVAQLAPQHVALVGIDCKGGMELGLFESRLSALATSRREAAAALDALVIEMQERMLVCREVGVRSIWQLPEKLRPVPIVVIVDELAELYLHDGTRESKAEAEQCSVYLLRIAQLGAVLGLHLVVAGQRIGSELGSGVTALRAQLSGRICHAVNDPGTAEMTLGDLAKDAVAAAQSITAEEKGVAICLGADGGWSRARSHLTTIDQAREITAKHSHLTPVLPGVHRALLMADGDGAS
ncbi:cell division protein FtsK [Streptomyces sp. ET3-23]|uniref:FtsK/SpoIIIE domain-containing protein n=1 Tax=Streptomyces sp. ET3-23 TaxID=2885643 RepID=UPI001D0F9535|nr:FtsK/SpoIIIE domain-containing protein [Streptomyces sp. ET3-23]MCC2275750.1 cell division protein FtsK [Streptomyces sp. ET3-23]